MRDDRNTGTSEFKAVARDAAQLGTRFAHAARAWFDARRAQLEERDRTPQDGNDRQSSHTREGWAQHGDDWRQHQGVDDAAHGGAARSAGGPGARAAGPAPDERGDGDNTYGRQGGFPGGSASGHAGGTGGTPAAGVGTAGAAPRGGHRGKGPRNFSRSDERIREDVCVRLSDDDGVDASGIEVEVKGGVVTLLGTVDERRMKHLAEDLAEACNGVRDVDNRIRVQRAGDSGQAAAAVSSPGADDAAATARAGGGGGVGTASVGGSPPRVGAGASTPAAAGGGGPARGSATAQDKGTGGTATSGPSEPGTPTLGNGH